MAIDQAEKRRALARQCVQTAPLLMNVLYSLDALRSQRDNGGPNGTPLVFTDPDFTGQNGLTHVDAATINAMFTAIPTLLQAFSNQQFDNVFESLRP